MKINVLENTRAGVGGMELHKFLSSPNDAYLNPIVPNSIPSVLLTVETKCESSGQRDVNLTFSSCCLPFLLVEQSYSQQCKVQCRPKVYRCDGSGPFYGASSD
jgi:hypothetical protein